MQSARLRVNDWLPFIVKVASFSVTPVLFVTIKNGEKHKSFFF